MKKLKTFLVWLIFGYDNRPIRTYLEHNRNNLIVVGLHLPKSQPFLSDYKFYKLSIPNVDIISLNDHQINESKSFKVLEIDGDIFFKPSIDTEIGHKIVFLYPFLFGFLGYEFGLWFWAVSCCIIINLYTWINQFKNHQILRIKIDEIHKHLKFLNYLKFLRLKITIERLYNFKNRALSDYENILHKKDVQFLEKIMEDREFLVSVYPTFDIDLEYLIKEFDIQITKYKEIIDSIELILINHSGKNIKVEEILLNGRV
jgi:hypothetical protein